MPEAAQPNQFTTTSSTDTNGNVTAAGSTPAGGNAPAGPNATASPGATAGAASAEQPAPYGGPASAPAAPPRRIRTLDLIKAKAEGRRWAMLTSYDQYTAALFEQAGVEALLIGDSAANNVYGHATTLPVTVDELIPLARAVASATARALIVADLPFGSY
ncbi:MAG TPA: 3-methyl-2-oxobutanoate hydroxymethyltransferase, partial [Brevibacterium linens]|nr:3-methyl-2-oxobutanoate hydroxymethyltransferase [Brevibacterium linens]